MQKIVARRLALHRTVIGLFVVALCGAGCWPAGRVPDGLGTATDDVHAAATHARVSVPTTATNRYGQMKQFQETASWLRFDLPQAELDPFLVAHGCNGLLQPIEPHSVGSAQEIAWWAPGQATRLELCSMQDGNFGRSIMVDRSQASSVTIFVFASTG